MTEETTVLSARQRLEALKKRQVSITTPDLSATQAVEASEKDLIAKRDEIVQATIKENDLYKIIHEENLSKEEQVERLTAFFAYDPEQSESKIKMAQDYLYFIQMVRKKLAVGHIEAIANQILMEYQQTLDKVYEDLGGFQETIKPLRDVFELIQKYNKEEEEGKAEPLHARIVAALAQQKALKQQQETRHWQMDRLNNVLSRRNNDLEALNELVEKRQNSFLGKWRHKDELANIERRLDACKTEILATEAEKKQLQAQPLTLPDNKEYDPNLIRILDVSGQEFNTQAKKATELALQIINASQDRLNESICGLLDVQTGVSELFHNASDIDMFVSTLQIASKSALKQIYDATQAEKASKEQQEAANDDGLAELDKIEQNITALRKQRYMSDLQSYARSLGQTSSDVKTGGTSISVLDENLRFCIEHAESIRSNTIATVAEAVANNLQAIVFESHASKTDMIAGALNALHDAASNAQNDQIGMLATWFKKDNKDTEKRIETMLEMTDLLTKTRDELLDAKSTANGYNMAMMQAIEELRNANDKVRTAIVTPVFTDGKQPSDTPAANEPHDPDKGGKTSPWASLDKLGL